VNDDDESSIILEVEPIVLRVEPIVVKVRRRVPRLIIEIGQPEEQEADVPDEPATP